MNIRLAQGKDVEQLIKMSWDFTIEHEECKEKLSFVNFEKEGYSFFEKALTSGQWFVLVVEEGGIIVSHMYIEVIQKVPRTGRVTQPFAYLTSVFTLPEYRNMGIECKLLCTINDWIKANDYECFIQWPGGEAISSLQKNSYMHSKQPMEDFPKIKAYIN